ncbi:MAG: DUF885 domain-containing protein [Candidatus Eiseniibacteriota bacterium]
MQGLPSNTTLAATAKDFIQHLFASDPVYATAVGEHGHDHLLPVHDKTSRARATGGYISLLDRFEAIEEAGLDPADRLDLRVLRNGAKAALFELEDERPWQNDPNFYIRQAGESVSGLLKRDFAPAAQRYENALKRIAQFPAYFDQATHNLIRVPQPHVQVALLQVDGLSQFLEETLLSQIESQAPALLERARKAVDEATTALVAFEKYLKGLAHKPGGDWRLGDELYAEKLENALVAGLTPAKLNEWAQSSLRTNRARMEEVAKQMGASSVREALNRIEQDKPGRNDLLDRCKHYCKELEAFLRSHDLVTMPDEIALKVDLTPEFNRGVPGASCDPPGVLEAHLPTYFYVTPIPDSWTPEQTDDYLREYNEWQLRILAVHEALPGHYLQLWHANRNGRAVPNILWNGAFAEGWAVYSEQLMLEAGLNTDPRHELAQLKFWQRAVLNAIIDAGLHAGGMKEEEALRLLLEEGYQTKKVAEEKIKRAQVTSVQLSTYFVGWQQIVRLREEQKAARGPAFNLREFNDALLSHGTPPLPYVRDIFFGEVPASEPRA